MQIKQANQEQVQIYKSPSWRAACAARGAHTEGKHWQLFLHLVFITQWKCRRMHKTSCLLLFPRKAAQRFNSGNSCHILYYSQANQQKALKYSFTSSSGKARVFLLGENPGLSQEDFRVCSGSHALSHPESKGSHAPDLSPLVPFPTALISCEQQSFKWVFTENYFYYAEYIHTFSLSLFPPPRPSLPLFVCVSIKEPITLGTKLLTPVTQAAEASLQYTGLTVTPDQTLGPAKRWPGCTQ